MGSKVVVEMCTWWINSRRAGLRESGEYLMFMKGVLV
jgi:hypothetical protein